MKPKGLFILDKKLYEIIYPAEIRSQIDTLVDIYGPVMSSEDVSKNPDILQQMQFMFSGWGCPVLDDAILKHSKNLQTVFYGAGSVKHIVSDSFWDRKLRITTAAAANGIPVAQYMLSQVLFCLKSGWSYVRKLHNTKQWKRDMAVAGIYNKSKVGVISLGVIGKQLADYLKTFEVEIIAYDPFVQQWPGVQMKSLEDLFAQCDVVVCCTPITSETKGMIGREYFESMKPEASFINAARGIVIKQNEMIDVLQKRDDLTAVLDVTWPEPPEENSSLWTMDNVVLTPHIAGSMNSECGRMGRFMLEELEQILQDGSLKYEVTQDMLKRMA